MASMEYKSLGKIEKLQYKDKSPLQRDLPNSYATPLQPDLTTGGYVVFVVVRLRAPPMEGQQGLVLYDVKCSDTLTFGGTKALPPHSTRKWNLDLSNCKTLVLQRSNLFLLEGKEYEIVVEVSVRVTVLDELEGIDSMLRENNRESIDRREVLIKAFTAAYTQDGSIFFWKKQKDTLWYAGSTSHVPSITGKGLQEYILPYSYPWVRMLGKFVGRETGCCLATFAAAMRTGAVSLHPRTKPFMFMTCPEQSVQALCIVYPKWGCT